MLQAVEGDFCNKGIDVVLEHVKDGVLGPDLLFKTFRCVCTCRVHAPHCTSLYHHHDVTVPTAAASTTLQAMYPRVSKNSRFVAMLLTAVNSHMKAAVSVLMSTSWPHHPALMLLGRHKLAQPVPGKYMRLFWPAIERDKTLQLQRHSVDDDVAAHDAQLYLSYLRGERVSARRAPWQLYLAQVTYESLRTRLPEELCHIVIAYLPYDAVLA